jgi:hypothetical protein
MSDLRGIFVLFFTVNMHKQKTLCPKNNNIDNNSAWGARNQKNNKDQQL